MAHQRNPAEVGIQAQATGIAYLNINSIELSDAFLDEVSGLLGVREEPQRSGLHRMLRAQARSYLAAKAFKATHPSPQDSMRAIARFAGALREALTNLELISFEHRCAVDMVLNDQTESDRRSVTLMQTLSDIEQVEKAAAFVVEKVRPGDRRPRNRPLELTVGALMLLFEQVTGRRATASLKRDGSHEPRLTSKEAQAIGLVLRAVDTKINDVAIASKIVEIRKAYKGRALSEFAPILMAGMPARVTPYGPGDVE
jgi:hypothetical protein